MVVIIGLVIVVVFVFGGFAMSGGNLVLIFAPWHEFLIIGGAALGGLIAKTSSRTLKMMFRQILRSFKGGGPTKALYTESLKLIQNLAQVARKDGVLVFESHLKDPSRSPIFSKYPAVIKRPDIIRFVSDNLNLVLVGISPHELDLIMEMDIETLTEEIAGPQSILANTADALPGLGIVAAVMGIIKTMSAINEGPAVVGEKVAAALVGTFLGVLLSYGFVGPVATNIEMANLEEMRILQVYKQGLMGIALGSSPKVSAEFSRRAIYSDLRPSFDEVYQS